MGFKLYDEIVPYLLKKLFYFNMYINDMYLHNQYNNCKIKFLIQRLNIKNTGIYEQIIIIKREIVLNAYCQLHNTYK